MLSSSLLALLITFILALVWLRLNDFVAQRGWVSSSLSRKIIHMGTGPLFVACWLFFPQATNARYLAASVPLLITLQFLLVGLGVIKDDAAIQAMSRHGDRREILRGPLFYGVVFILLTVIYWYDTPVGIVALMLMCGGDGLAEILGRRYGHKRLPWNHAKSWVGSLGMFVGGWLFSLAILAVFSQVGVFPHPWRDYLLPLTPIALGGTLVESLPIPDVDNLTVTVITLILGHIFF